jgi:hypothetical protein
MARPSVERVWGCDRIVVTASFDITIDGEIHPDFVCEFAPATVTCAGGLTTLHAEAIDQAALHAILDRIARHGLTLLSLSQSDEGRKVNK